MSKHKKGYKGSQRRAAARKQPMWLWATVGGLLLVFVLFLISQVNKGSQTSAASDFTPEVKGNPHVAVDQEKIDYGDVKLGNTINTVMDVRNTGDQTLLIQQNPQVEAVEGC